MSRSLYTDGASIGHGDHVTLRIKKLFLRIFKKKEKEKRTTQDTGELKH